MPVNRKLTKTVNGVVYEVPVFFMDVMNITQGCNGYFSHSGTQAIDCAGKDTGVDPIFAPVTMRYVTHDTPQNGNAIWFESVDPVLCADGTINYLTFMWIHDDNIQDVLNLVAQGHIFAQGEEVLDEGKSGYVTGNHSHGEVKKGKFTQCYVKNSSGVWQLPDAVSPDAIYVVDGITLINNGQPPQGLGNPMKWKTSSQIPGTAASPSASTSSHSSFSDVDNNAYYADSVQWAKDAGIVYGRTSETFQPDSPATRAEVVEMLKRFENYLNGTVKPDREPVPSPKLTYPCEGIDISEHNGDIDLTPYTNNNFVIIRAGWWINEDQKFKRNVELCEKLGIPYGLYWYSYALDEEQALLEANAFIELANTCKPNFGLWVDVEPDNWKRQNHPQWAKGYPDKEYLYPIVDTFCKTLEKAGYDVGIYAGNGFYDRIPERYALWYPNYNINDGNRHDNGYINICYIHQYTSNPIDRNYAYADPFRERR